MKTLILGMGNDLLSDDGVGIKVARRLAQVVRGPDVEVRETCLAGVELLDILAGFDRAILVDAIKTGAARIGEVHLISPEDLDRGTVPASLHHVDLPSVLALGKSLGLKMPGQVQVIAVEAADISTFGKDCCPEVEAAIPRIVDLVVSEISAGGDR